MMKLSGLEQVKVLLWACGIFLLMNTISAGLFALQVGVIEPTAWSTEFFNTIYGYQAKQVTLMEVAKVFATHIGFPLIVLSAVFLGLLKFFKKINILDSKVYKFVFKQLISLKLAVLVIIVIAVISAIGTFVEAKYDAKMAQTLVFHSTIMYITLFLLCLQLLSVMVDRWPWKVHHAPFVLAHIGIIVILYGSILTRYFGVDGSVVFEIGQTQKHITLGGEEFLVYSAFADGNYSLMSKQRVNFFKDTPTEDDPYVVGLGDKKLKVVDYYHYAIRNAKIARSKDKLDNPAVRVQIEGSRASSTKWLWAPRGRSRDQVSLGPMQIVLTNEAYRWDGKQNIIALTVDSKGESLKYSVYSLKNKKKINSGKLVVGDSVATGFMDFNLRVVNLYKHAAERITYEKREYPSKVTQAAVKVDFDGKSHWLGLNNLLRLYANNASFVISFANTRVGMGFPMKLERFDVGHYQGTKRAMTYKSEVEVPKLGEQVISMNEPLKYNGFTFYQASFQQDEMGNPIASILSVNKDPGRFLKYLGSILVVLGSILLFYFKRMVARAGRKAS